MLSNKWTYGDTVYSRSAFSLPLVYDFISRYRNVSVVEVNGAYELRVRYKGLPISDWAKRYGVKEDAIAWAVVQANNRSIIMGILTLVDYNGRRRV